MLLLLPGVAHAQAFSFKIGPRLTLIHDSNLARSSREVAELRGLERSDFRYSPGVDLQIQRQLSRQLLFLSADIGYDFHRRNTQLNRHRLLIEAGARLQFSRCTGNLVAGYSSKQSEIGDLLDLADVRNLERTRSLGFDARCGGPIGLVPSFGFDRSVTENDSDIRRRSDNRSTSATFGLAYARPSFGSLGLNSTFTKVRYPHRDVLPDDALTDDGYRVTTIGIRYERDFGTRINGSVSLNHTKVRPNGSTRPFSGITASGGINFVVTPALKARLDFSRDVRPANDLGGSYNIVRSVAAQADYALGSRISLSAGASQEDRNIRGGDGLSLVRLDNERRRSVFGRVAYKRGERASTDFELRHEVRTADPSIFNYTSTRATANYRIFL